MFYFIFNSVLATNELAENGKNSLFSFLRLIILAHNNHFVNTFFLFLPFF
jgi:hypothetical protein